MKALVYTDTMKTEFREEANPVAGDGEVIVDLSHCGICGSDMHAWHGHDERRIPPLILGHEASGIVRSGNLAGQRVTLNPLMTCGNCVPCTSGNEHLCASRELIGMRVPGAFAEAVAIRERNLHVLADTLSFEDAALTEPLAVAVHAVELAKRHLNTNRDQTNTVVLGGGAIGLLCALVLSVEGYENIAVAEVNPLRRELLEKVSDVRAYDPISDKAPSNTQLVLDCVGSGRTRAASAEMVSPGGTIIHVGLQDNEPGLDTRRITLQEIAFVGAYCYTDEDFANALKLLENKKITRNGWSEIRPLSEGSKGFEDIHNGNALPKIILEI